MILTTSYVLWGMGMLTSFLILALYFHRLTIHHLPDAEVAFSSFLPLGPLGQGAFACLKPEKLLSKLQGFWAKAWLVR